MMITKKIDKRLEGNKKTMIWFGMTFMHSSTKIDIYKDYSISRKAKCPFNILLPILRTQSLQFFSLSWNTIIVKMHLPIKGNFVV